MVGKHRRGPDAATVLVAALAVVVFILVLLWLGGAR